MKSRPEHFLAAFLKHLLLQLVMLTKEEIRYDTL